MTEKGKDVEEGPWYWDLENSRDREYWPKRHKNNLIFASDKRLLARNIQCISRILNSSYTFWISSLVCYPGVPLNNGRFQPAGLAHYWWLLDCIYGHVM